MPRPSVEIVYAVADAAGTDPGALDPPLHDVLDVDALDALLDPTPEDRQDDSLAVHFEYAGYRVTAARDGTLHVD